MAETSKVIHVRNVGHEITENDLLQLVEPFGTVTKLVMLRTKNQALLQLQDMASAINLVDYYTNVQPNVRGRNVYMQFSSHQELTTDQTQGRKSDTDGQPNRILLVSIHQVIYPMTVDVLNQVFSPYGFVEKIVTFQKSAGYQALIQFQTRQSAASAMSALHVCYLLTKNDAQVLSAADFCVWFCWQQSGYGDAGGAYPFQATGSGSAGYGQMGHAAAMSAFAGGLPPGVSGNNDRCTVIVSNLNPDRIDEDKLFNLFSLYGNIIRIKLLRGKPDHALVEMSDGFQAELAVNFLKGALLFGKRIEVNFSKYSNITPSPDTRDYQNSNLNRFNHNAAKHYKYCCSPTKMIHLSSVPEDASQEEIVDLLEEHGQVVSTKIFEANGKKQVLVLFETEEEATEALVCKHATSFCGSIIRISFSQSQNT
uniref:RRM domain-containing protein n=1 Tax=Chenopodium quinoa TaxID=63459 RepID=A0A803KX79_CHEQI